MFKSTFLFLLGLLLFSCGDNSTSKQKVSDQKRPPSINYSSGTVDEARLFAPGIISSEENSEFDVMFSPDGKRAYFSRRAPEQKQKIYETDFVDGSWSVPKVCRFSTDRDEAASITPDGQLFFFGSERPIPSKPNKGNFDMNVWMMTKNGESWSAPKPLPFPINDVQVEGEEWPSSNNSFLSAVDNNTFYYTTMVRGEKAIKLYETSLTDGTFSAPKEIKGLFADERYWVYSAVVSPDGKYLVFNSFAAPGGVGGEDIFVSRREGDGWSQARPMGSKVNTIHEEGGSRFSRDGKYFFFSRAKNLGNDQYGEWSILHIETEYLELDKLFADE